jgi:zinc protease
MMVFMSGHVSGNTPHPNPLPNFFLKWGERGLSLCRIVFTQLTKVVASSTQILPLPWWERVGVRGKTSLFLLLFTLFVPQESKAMVAIQDITTPSGIKAWLVEDHAVPLVTINFMVKGGAAADGATKAGLTTVATQMLLEGAGQYDSLAFSKQLDEYAVRLSFNTGRDYFSGTLQTLTENLPKAIELASLALTQPRLDKTSFARVKAQQLSSLQAANQNPAEQAKKLWWRTAFKGHPYSVPTEGEMATVEKLTLKDVQEFAATRLGRNALIISVAGAVNKEQATAIVEGIFGNLPVITVPAPVAVQAVQKSGNTVVEKVSLPQSVAIFGQTGVRRIDKDYYAATLLNYVIGGGGFASRLMHEVREKRGLTYGIGTALSDTIAQPLFFGQVSSANETVTEALTLTKQILADIAKNGITAQELQDAKDHENGSFPLDLDNTDRLASLASAMQYYDLPKDFLEKRESLISAVTLDQINQLAAKVFHSDALVIAIVGNPQ